jgi:hypothetical protein
MPLLLLFTFAVGARFEQKQLNVYGDARSLASADFDGDGFVDLLVVHQRGTVRAKKRTVAIFWNQRGTLAQKPDLVLPVPDDACAYDVADIDDQKGSELLWIGHDGVSAMHFRDRDNQKTSVLTREPTLFLHADKDDLPRLMVAQAVSGQGLELLVPVTDAVAIYRHGGGGWFSVGRLDASLAAIDVRRGYREPETPHLGSFDLTIDFPEVHVADANGDGLKDVVFENGDRVAIFHQAPGLAFTKDPTFMRDFAVATEQELEQGFTQVATQVRDLDADGVVDLVITKQVNQGITSGSSTTYVFMGQPGGGYGKSADQTITNDGIGGTVSQLFDLTGDGKPELLLPAVKMGVLAIIRVLTTQTLKVAVGVHPFSGKRFSDKPVAERELAFKVSLSGKSNLQAIDLRGDYNGDKLRDLAFGTTGGDLAIYPGTGKGPLIAEDPAEKIAVNPRGRMQPLDLDNDGKDEIVLYYPGSTEERGLVVVLFNRGPW